MTTTTETPATPTGTETARFTASLRALADWLDTNPGLTRDLSYSYAQLAPVGGHEDPKARMAEFIRAALAAKLPVRKDYDETWGTREECTAYLQGGPTALHRLRRHVTHHRPGGGEPSEEAPPSRSGGVPRAVGGASWMSPRYDGAGAWRRTAPHVSTRRKWTTTLLVCFLIVGALWLSQVALRPLMCAINKDNAGHGALSYCSDYVPTTTTTETTR